ncbi:LOW QUALITY PROTEIN: hypothetical protein HID58_093446, partial [Brassica napus]
RATGSIYLPLVDSNRRDQPLLGLSEKKVFYGWNIALAAVELVSSGYGRPGPPSLGRILLGQVGYLINGRFPFILRQEKSLGLEDGGRSQTRGQGPGTQRQGPGPGAGTRKTEAGVISSWNIFPQHKVLGDFCVQVIRAQHYRMIGRRRLVVVVLSPASVVDKPGDPALRVVPYGYGLCLSSSKKGRSLGMNRLSVVKMQGHMGLQLMVSTPGELGALICFDDHGVFLSVCWRSWSGPILALAAVELVSSGSSDVLEYFLFLLDLGIILLAQAGYLINGRFPFILRQEKSLGLEDGGRNQTRGQRPGTQRQEPGPWGQGPGRRKEAGVISSWNIFPQQFAPYFLASCLKAENNMTFFVGLYKFHRSITLPCRSFSDALALDETLPPWWGSAGVGRKFDGEAGNIGIKVMLLIIPQLYSASAQAGQSGSTNRLEECMGQYPGIMRGRILAKLRIRRTKRLNKTRRPKLRILILDSTGLACASQACKGCNGLSGGSPCRFPCCLLASSLDCTLTLAEGTFSMFVLVLGDNLVDSWYRSRSPGHVSHNQCWDDLASCFHGTQRILGMLSQILEVRGCNRRLYRLSSRNPEAGWTLVKEPVAFMDLSPGTLRIFVREPDGCMDLQGDLPIYLFDSKSSSSGRLSLIARLFGAVSSFASSSYPLGSLKDGTRCARLVNLEY